MTTAAALQPMTTEELLALPDDGKKRWLIRGRLRELPSRFEDQAHAATLAGLGCVLGNWARDQCRPVGEVLAMIGCRLRHDPDTTASVDVAYVSHETPNDAAGLVDGLPILAAEILGRMDRYADVHERIDEYLDVGVGLVWLLHPHDRTVTIYRPGCPPEMVNDTQDLIGDPELPGFRVAVALLFS